MDTQTPLDEDAKPAAAARDQYPQLNSDARRTSQACLDGRIDEDSARWRLASATIASGVIDHAVNAWLRNRPDLLHLEADLVSEAVDWVTYRITRHALGSNMRPERQTREPVDLNRIAAGESLAWFVYKGVMLQMTKFVRSLNRHSTTHHRIDLADQEALLVADAQPSTAQPSPEHQTFEDRTRLILDWYNDTVTSRTRELKVIWASAEALCATYTVPPGSRPADSRQRQRMAERLHSDGRAAHRSLIAVSADDIVDEAADDLAPVWTNYSRREMDALLTCPQPEQAAASICLAAVSNLPSLSRSESAHVRRTVGGLVKGHPAQLLVHRMLDRMLKQEFGEPSTGHSSADARALASDLWHVHAADIASRYPDLLGECPSRILDTVLSFTPWSRGLDQTTTPDGTAQLDVQDRLPAAA